MLSAYQEVRGSISGNLNTEGQNSEPRAAVNVYDPDYIYNCFAAL